MRAIDHDGPKFVAAAERIREAVLKALPK